jgi:hypothetical protein
VKFDGSFGVLAAAGVSVRFRVDRLLPYAAIMFPLNDVTQGSARLCGVIGVDIRL